MANLRDLAAALSPQPGRTPPPSFRQGVVSAVVAGPPASVTITLGGSTVAIAGVRYLASYTPTVGHTVWVVVQGTDLWVVGRLA